MVARLRALGLPASPRARSTPTRSRCSATSGRRATTAPLPELLDSKLPILIRLVRQLPGHYRFTPSKDIADEIEWAKARRIGPRDYEGARPRPGPEPPIPVDLFVRTFEGYERAKARAGRIDFDDLLVGTVDCSRPTRPRRTSARASAGSASTSTRTRTRSSSGCSSCGSAIARPVRRRRRGPDDLHVHGRLVHVPDLVHRALAGCHGGRARPELPVPAAGPGAREPAARRGGSDEAPRGDPRRRPRARDQRAPVRRRGAGLAHGGIRARLGEGTPRPRSPCSCA